MPKEATIERDVMGVEDLAEYLGISKITVYKQAEHGLLPGFKIGGLWKFQREEIEQWMKKKQELEQFKWLSFAERVNFVWGKMRKGFERAGYTMEDVPRLIAEVRAEKKKTSV